MGRPQWLFLLLALASCCALSPIPNHPGGWGGPLKGGGSNAPRVLVPNLVKGFVERQPKVLPPLPGREREVRAADEQVLDQLLAEICQCPVCLSLLYKPTTLSPCGHTFCMR